MSVGLKQRLPWQAKLVGKLALSRLPVNYDVWRRLALFKHGSMEDPAYAFGVFTEHLSFAQEAAGPFRSGFVAMELGPGDTASSALIAHAFDASGSVLVDVAPFARQDTETYDRLRRFLVDRGLNVPPLPDDFQGMLKAVNSRYLTSGLDALRALGSSSVDFIFSHAVLEHIRLEEFDQLLTELRRIIAPDGTASHQIDFQDHLAHSINSLRFSSRVWESPAVGRSGFYTNRLRCSQVVGRFEAAGFSVEVVREDRWPNLPLRREALNPSFRGLSDADLCVRGATLVARPR